MIVIKPLKMKSDAYWIFDRVGQLNKYLGREVYRLEEVGKDKFKLLSVKVINGEGNAVSCLLIVPAVSATYMREIVDELWHMLHREAV